VKHRAILLLATILTLASMTFSMAGPVSSDGTAVSNLASTPPMGWNSWNKFGCNVSEDLVRQTADALVASGMKDAGYQYVVIDDCWQIERDGRGNIVADPKRFPSGMKALADYVHGKGLKFGLYSDAGTKTCGGRPGSRGYEFQDARQYAVWGVDYLKYDWCNTSTQDARSSYETMRAALDASGRAIVFSICEWGKSKPWLWGKEIGNLWRTTGDIQDRWQGIKNWRPGDCCNYGMTDILDQQVGLETFAGPGHWNDPDMLEVGNGGMTAEEYRAHFSLWAILAAPLIAGNDLRDMKPEIREILTRNEVIAVDQDAAGSQGRRVHKDGNLEVWSKTLRDGSRAVVLFNRGTDNSEIGVSWEDLGYPAQLSAKVRDLWQRKDLGERKGSFSAIVAPHSVVMVTVRP
jgi:alpha-galactosidase